MTMRNWKFQMKHQDVINVKSKSTDEACIFKGKHKIKIISTRQLQDPSHLPKRQGPGKRRACLSCTDPGALGSEGTAPRPCSGACAVLPTRTPGQGLGQTVLLPLSKAKAERGSQNHPKVSKTGRPLDSCLSPTCKI